MRININVHILVLFLMFTISTSHAGEIKLGMTTALSGPAKALGLGMKTGIEAYFKKINKAGGIKGQRIKLIALDDRYEPDRAAPNMRKLIEQEKVLAVIGNVGTPTAIVTVPIANEKKILLFGAFTGAGVLRKSPPDRYVINYRASYEEETAAMIKGLLDAGVKPKEIAFFTQRDGYGDAGYNGAIKALKASGFEKTHRLAHGRYTRNTLNIENGLAKILEASVEPKAIIMVGAYAPNAKFIKLAKRQIPNALFLNVSFVGSNALAAELGAKGEGVIVTQVVPHFNADLPVIAEYKKALAQHNPNAKPGFVSLEGYLAAKLFVAGLQKVASNPTRENIIDALESLKNVDIGLETKFSFSKTKHQASHQVWPTRITGKTYITFDWNELKTNMAKF